ncbi:MAG: NUDIX hydrolase [Candidatus Nanohaloarchaea archaeon]|nr:NUDIX hydrolase [Candidatus Nanohaloarchaea archaeon]
MERNRHRVAADIIITRDSEVLLIRRGKEPFEGMWALPGGHVEEGEQVAEAAEREAEEETGLDVELDGLFGLYDEPGRDPRGPVITLVYTASPVDGELEGATDADEARWFPLDDLPEELAFDHADILDDYLEERSGF